MIPDVVGPFDKKDVSNLGSTTEVAEEPVVNDVRDEDPVEDFEMLWSLRPSGKLFKLGCDNLKWLTCTTVGGTTSFFEPVICKVHNNISDWFEKLTTNSLMSKKTAHFCLRQKSAGHKILKNTGQKQIVKSNKSISRIKFFSIFFPFQA